MTERTHDDMGITRLGIGMPNYDRELSIPVDQYLQTIETAWREVWPEVKGELTAERLVSNRR